MEEKKREKIGIMADSHGRPEAIAAGAVYLKRKGCTALFHLGDICDSTMPGTADDCVAQVKKYGIGAVKGNNDHTLAANARGLPNGDMTLAFLDDLFCFPSLMPNWSTPSRLSGGWACQP
jgi:predicted phosphodiesterase